MKSEGWAPLWVDADSKKCQIQMVQMTKKPSALFLSYNLSIKGQFLWDILEEFLWLFLNNIYRDSLRIQGTSCFFSDFQMIHVL